MEREDIGANFITLDSVKLSYRTELRNREGDKMGFFVQFGKDKSRDLETIRGLFANTPSAMSSVASSHFLSHPMVQKRWCIWCISSAVSWDTFSLASFTPKNPARILICKY
jgi:hypothetical protein